MPSEINLGANFEVTFNEDSGTLVIEVDSDEIQADGIDLGDLNSLQLQDATADPATNGEFQRNGSDAKVFSGGSVRNLSNVGSGGGGDVSNPMTENLDAGGFDITNIGEVGTTDLSFDGATAQLRQDGMVVPIAAGLGSSDAIDRSTATTPLQDATDLVAAQPNGGRVLLPSGGLTEEQPYNPASGVSVYGPNPADCIVDFPNGDGIVFNSQTRRVDLYGFRVRGPGDDGAAADAVTFNDMVVSSKIRIDIHGWYGHAMHFVSGQTFEIDVPYVRMQDVDAGDAGTENSLIEIETSGGGGGAGPAVRFGTIAAYPSNTTSGSDSNIVFHGSGDMSAQHLNVGGTAARAYSQELGQANLGQINYEPDSSAGTADSIVYTRSNRPVYVGQVRGRTGAVDYIYRIGFFANDPANKILGPVLTTGTTVNNTTVSVDSEPGGESWFFGPESEVTDNHSGTANGLVRSLASAGAGNA